MSWPQACAACIPCLNEEATIAAVVSGVRRHLPHVVVVDDGSADKTAEVARRAGATVLRNENPTGKGSALQRAWTWAAEAGFDWVLTLDGDGQHAAEEVPRFFECAEATRADLVVGNRMTQPEQMPWVRRQVNRWMSRKLSKRASANWPDTQCGFRLIRLKPLQQATISAEHFEIESDVLLAFARNGRRIEFIPIRTIYKSEQSKIHPIKDTLRWFRWWGNS